MISHDDLRVLQSLDALTAACKSDWLSFSVPRHHACIFFPLISQDLLVALNTLVPQGGSEECQQA